MLQRAIGKYTLILLVVNSIIGAGIFGLPSRVFSLVGVYSLYAIGICAVIVFVFALCFGEVSSRFSQTGGPYLYVQEAFGSYAGFGTGWLLYLGRLINYAALINLIPTYLQAFGTPFSDAAMKKAVVVVTTASLLLLNLRGTRQTAVASNWLTVIKLLPLFALVLTGPFFVKGSNFRVTTHVAIDSFSQAVMLLIFAFGGFETVLINSGEIKSPGRNLPRALLVGIGLVAALYMGIQAVCIGLLPGLASEKAPLAAAASAIAGKTGEFAIVSGAVVSILGTLNVLLFTASRLPYALAENKQLPALMARVHPVSKVPGPALYLSAGFALVASFAWGFLGALALGVAIRLIIYLAVCLAMLRLRLSNDHPASFRLRFGYAAAISGLLCCTALLSVVKINDWKILLLLSLAGYAGFAWQKTKSARTKE